MVSKIHKRWVTLIICAVIVAAGWVVGLVTALGILPDQWLATARDSLLKTSLGLMAGPLVAVVGYLLLGVQDCRGETEVRPMEKKPSPNKGELLSTIVQYVVLTALGGAILFLCWQNKAELVERYLGHPVLFWIAGGLTALIGMLIAADAIRNRKRT